MQGQTIWIRWLLRPLISIVILEIGLSFVPIPDWWEAAVFDEYLYSSRISKVLFDSSEYNSMGYRDTDWEKDSKKIAFLGDSRTFGLFVKPHETYVEQLEAMSDWEGMNLGLPGATTFEALDSLLPDALVFSPTASVVCLDLNSSLISYLPKEKTGGRNDIVRNLIRSSSIWMFLEGGWHSVFTKREPIISLQEYGRQLHEIFQKLDKNGVEKNILLLGWTPLQDYPDLYTQARYDDYREMSRKVARENSIPIIEFTDELEGLSLEQAFLGEHQIHLSVEGHRRIAKAVLRVLDAP